MPAHRQIEQLASYFNEAERVTLLCGAGSRRGAR